MRIWSTLLIQSGLKWAIDLGDAWIYGRLRLIRSVLRAWNSDVFENDKGCYILGLLHHLFWLKLMCALFRHNIQVTCKLLIYADDSAIFFVHKDVDFIFVKLGKVLEKCLDSLIDNRLSLHLGKNRMHVVWFTKEISQGYRFSYQMLRYCHQIYRNCQIFGCTNW